MIKLYQFRPFWGLPNASPFCMKAETYLRYREIEFKAVACNPRQSPSKEIPFITIDEQGDSRTITDSEKIIGYFESRQDNPMDVGLTAQQKALAFLIRSKVEEELYWQITYMCWGNPQGWAVFLPDLKIRVLGVCFLTATLPYHLHSMLC